MAELAMMIDIETLSLRPDAYVTQVGVCIADVVTREYVLAPSNCWLTKEGQEHRHIDFDTVRWWMTQDRDVARGVFEAPGPRNTQWALFNLLKKWTDQYPDMTVWASPAMFDLPILTSLWGGQKPWVYNMERCLMTLYKVLDPQKALTPKDANPKEHDAACDAQAQMEYLLNLLEWQHENGARADLPHGALSSTLSSPIGEHSGKTVGGER